jgi:uncharacterized membrane protein YoaK (UPF0700 family)
MSSTQPSMPDTAPGLPALLLLLAVTTGLIDAVSVLGLGKVFTANMTGNIVFLGFAAVGTHGFVAPLYLAAIGAFLLGAAAGGRLGNAYAATTLPNWLMRAAIVESMLLFSAAGVASAGEVPHRGVDSAVYVVIALTAIAMGVRNATVRKLKIADLTTTVLTLTLTGLAADSAIAGSGHVGWHRRAGSVGALLFGAAAGALLVNRCGLAPPLLLAASAILIGTTAWSSRQGPRPVPG